MDHKERHHEHHRHEREEHKKKRKQHEQELERNPTTPSVTTFWVLVLGGALLIGLVLLWLFVFEF